MFSNDHEPPHFHAIAGDERAAIAIDPPELLAGGLRPRVRARVLDWAESRASELLENWARARRHEALRAIAPED